MIERPKIPREQALVVAQQLYDVLSPFTERCKVVGSLRRHRSHVGDVELLFIPKMAPKPQALFAALLGAGPVDMQDMADLVINRMVEDGMLKKRPNTKGVTAWGPQNKLAVHVASGINVDLFATDAERWWVALVIRTGGKRTNLQLTMGANKQGLSLNAYGSGFTTLGNGVKIPCTSEQDVFRIAGVPYVEPQYRK